MIKVSTKGLAAVLVLLALGTGCSTTESKMAQSHQSPQYVTGSMIPVSKADAGTTDPTLMVYDKDTIQKSGAPDVVQFLRWTGVGRTGR